MFFLQIFRLLRALALSDLCVMVTGTLLHGLPGISSKYLNVIQPMIAPYLLPLAQVGLDLCYEKLLFILPIEKISPIFIFEIVLHSLDLIPSERNAE